MALAKHYKPRYTCWRPKTIREIATKHKRAERRAAKQQLRIEGEDYEHRERRPLTTWDFD